MYWCDLGFSPKILNPLCACGDFEMATDTIGLYLTVQNNCFMGIIPNAIAK
jgi:hypothetical protein